MRAAVSLNPRNSGLWIQYGEAAEARRDFGQAEACLLEAVRLDRTFAPRWMLSEYYFRRRDLNRFLPAVRAALNISYDDVSPLFQELWDLSSDPDLIQNAIPERAAVLRQYLNFLVDERKDLELALPVAARLGRHMDEEAVVPMLNLCDRLLEHERSDEAVGIWNEVSRSKLIRYGGLAPERGAVLTNGTLNQPFLEHGFDWRPRATDGVYVRAGTSSEPIRFTFSGRQPENCELLAEWLPLAGARRYALSVRYETGNLEGDTGTFWRVVDVHTGADLLRGAGRMDASSGTEKTFVFDVPKATRLAKLVFGYARVPGTERIEGSVSIRQVSVRPAQ